MDLTIYALVIAAVSLIAALASLIVIRDAFRRIGELELSHEIERIRHDQCAEVRAGLVRDARNGSRLRIINRGYAEARNVDVTIDGKNVADSAIVLTDDARIASLAPGAAIEYLLLLGNAKARDHEIDIVWSDDSEEAGHYRATFTTPASGAER